MAEATYVQDGKHIPHTPGSAVAQGEVVVVGELVGVADRAIAANEKGAITVEGVYDVVKDTGSSTAIDEGVRVYWDAAENQAGADDESGANKLLGKTILAAGDDDATVRVKLAGAAV